MKRLIVALFAVLISAGPGYAITPKTDYPRLGGTKFGQPHDYANPAMQDQLAKLDVIFLDFFPSWGTTAAMQQATVDIHARNPTVVLLDYVIQESIHNTFPGLAPVRAKHGARQSPWEWPAHRDPGGRVHPLPGYP